MTIWQECPICGLEDALEHDVVRDSSGIGYPGDFFYDAELVSQSCDCVLGPLMVKAAEEYAIEQALAS